MTTLASHQRINQTSGNVEYYTPEPILDAVRETLGWIDLDPASSLAANTRVQAWNIFTEREDGLRLPWHGKVWMNHPFGRGQNRAWITKIEEEHAIGRMMEGCCITFACTSEQWFQPLLRRPQCYLSPRTNYLLPGGGLLSGVTKGSVVTYYGENVDRFARAFAPLGVVKVCVHAASNPEPPSHE